MRYDFDATISYHAYGSVLYWEYGGDQSVLDASRSLARAVRGVTRYPLAGAGGLDAGGYKDWAMEKRSIPSVTIEIGTRECPLPQDEFHSIWERNRDVLPAIAAWVTE
jgi:g-D-glutamyl-meso-diaminopimelate peptidase